jgi:hypothetical protein
MHFRQYLPSPPVPLNLPPRLEISLLDHIFILGKQISARDNPNSLLLPSPRIPPPRERPFGLGQYLLIAGPGLGIQRAVEVEAGLVYRTQEISTVHFRYKGDTYSPRAPF